MLNENVDAPELDAVVTGRPLQQEADLSLLRAYEPVIRYTKGELFFPTAVGPYVAQCSLWAAGPKRGTRRRSCRRGSSRWSVCRAEGSRHRDRALFLRFVAEPLGHSEYLRWRTAAA